MSLSVQSLPDYRAARVTVIGDVMLDVYWQGSASRISPEAPVPIVRVGEVRKRAGGAGNVALNLAALGAQVELVGVCGDDEAAGLLEDILRSADVRTRLLRIPGMQTIQKTRVLSQHQQLIRLDFERDFSGIDSAPLLEEFSAAIQDSSVVVCSDYGKGTLAAIPQMLARARAAGKLSLIDPKGLDFERYRNGDLITPNLREFEAIVGPCSGDADIHAKGEALRSRIGLKGLLITRSEHGMSLIEDGQSPVHFESRAREIYDVTGAGDTVIAFVAAGLACGMTLEQATRIANVAAGISVSKLGAATVSPAELAVELARGHDTPSAGVVDWQTLSVLVQAAHSRGERVVFTNGCFDLLHAGHIQYLNQAATLGDRLVVALNDDASVSRLKGPERPISGLADRMQAVAGIRGVDWVTSFSQPTPYELISLLQPDVLVKGGDYQVDEVVGADVVRARGGEVAILNFRDGCSTSGLIQRIRS